jgi:hypothetical protein
LEVVINGIRELGSIQNVVALKKGRETGKIK